METIDKSLLAFTLSHSSVELLDKCPYSWFERYVMKLYPDNIEPNYPAEFGKLFHEVAEYYRGEGEPKVIELIGKFKHKYNINDEYERKIPIGIRNFLYFYNKCLVSAKKIFREKKIEILLNQFLAFLGLIDVLYQQEDGTWVIVDYKSSKKVGDYSIQLSGYFYLLSAISKTSPKKIKCQVVYLAAQNIDDVIQNYELDEMDKEVYEQRLLTTINKISNLGVDDVARWKKKPSALCPWCDYYKAGICQGNKALVADR